MFSLRLRSVRHLLLSISLVLGALPALSSAGEPVPAADPDPLLRGTVESMRTSGPLKIGGVPLESGRLLALFYASRGYRPAWDRPAQVEALLRAVEDGAADGLNPADYHLATLRKLGKPGYLEGLEPAARLGADLVLTDVLLRYTYHIRFGRLDPAAVSRAWNHRKAIPAEELVQSMTRVLAAADTQASLRELEPKPFFYVNLKRALEASGGARQLSGVSPIPQQRFGLPADGPAGPGTIAALNQPLDARKVDQIRINLERMRWFYADLPADYVLVDVAGFMAHVVRDGRVDWSTRVIVGTPKDQTPSFRDEMEHVVFNPTWTVPPSIQKKMHGVSSRFKVVDRHTGHAVGGANVSDNRRYSIVQGPGPTNALGRVKFMFPNDQAVYLHDTQSKGLFGQAMRAYSHGCVRVQNPIKLAEVILNRASWDQREINRVISTNKTRYVFLEERLPVLLYYLTAYADENGKVGFRGDLYGRDAALRQAINGPASELRIGFPNPKPLVDPAAVQAQPAPGRTRETPAQAHPVPGSQSPAPQSAPQAQPTPAPPDVPRATLTQGNSSGPAVTLGEPRGRDTAGQTSEVPGTRL